MYCGRAVERRRIDRAQEQDRVASGQASVDREQGRALHGVGRRWGTRATRASRGRRLARGPAEPMLIVFEATARVGRSPLGRARRPRVASRPSQRRASSLRRSIGMVSLADIVAASREVAATRSRTKKIARFAELLPQFIGGRAARRGRLFMR